MNPLSRVAIAVFSVLTWVAATWAAVLWLNRAMTGQTNLGYTYLTPIAFGVGLFCLAVVWRMFRSAKTAADFGGRGGAWAAGIVGYLLLFVIAAEVTLGVTTALPLVSQLTHK